MWPFSKKETFKKNTISRFPKKERADVLLVYPIWVKKEGVENFNACFLR
jgi:hypothetical protein